MTSSIAFRADRKLENSPEIPRPGCEEKLDSAEMLENAATCKLTHKVDVGDSESIGIAISP